MPFSDNPISRAISGTAKKLGIGNYTAADGTTITYPDLPPEIQTQIDQLGAVRDLADNSGDTATRDNYQQQINMLYDPSKRGQAQQHADSQRLLQQLNARLSAGDVRR